MAIDRFDRLGIAPRFRNTDSAELLYCLKSSDQVVRFDTNETYKSLIVLNRSRLAERYYLLNNQPMSVAVAPSVVETALDWLWGNWRQKHPNSHFRRQGGWVDQFACGASWAYFLGDVTAAKRLSEWVDDDLIELKQENQRVAFYRPIAYVVAGHAGAARSIDELKSKLEKRGRFVAETLEAILSGDSEKTAKGLAQMLKHFHKSRFDPEVPSRFLDHASSILAGYALAQGLQIELDDDAKLHLIEPAAMRQP